MEFSDVGFTTGVGTVEGGDGLAYVVLGAGGIAGFGA